MKNQIVVQKKRQKMNLSMKEVLLEEEGQKIKKLRNLQLEYGLLQEEIYEKTQLLGMKKKNPLGCYLQE